MRKRASSTVSAGSSARRSTRGKPSVAPDSFDPLNPLCARRSGLERVGEVLGLAGNLAIQELHHAHRVRGPAVIGEREFRDPKVAGADDPAHREALAVWLRDARGLDIVPAPDAFPRLGIFEYRILSVYVVLDVEFICVRGGPVAIERLSNLILTHPATPLPFSRSPVPAASRSATTHETIR